MAILNVFFLNSRNARLDPDKTEFRREINGSVDLTEEGQAIVNWNAVAYVRMVEEEDDD